MRVTRAVLLMLLVGASMPVSAEPTGLPPAAAGVVASANVELIASLPDVAAVGGRFHGDLLYVTTSSGVRIYDTASLDGIPLLLGALPLPHFENEDVDTNGEILLVSADHAVGPSNLYVIDVSNPRTPMLVGRSLFNEEGHTISCIPSQGNSCAYAWIAGSRSLPVFDLRNPAAPTQVASFSLPRPANNDDPTCNAGSSHDVQLDDAGIAWVSAGGGLFGYTYANPRAPVLVHQNCASSLSESTALNSSFIIHNSLRPNASQLDSSLLGNTAVDPGELVLVTEEDYLSNCSDEGAFQAAWLHKTGTTTRLDRIDSFTLGQGTVEDGRKPNGGLCSSHYFDYRSDGIAAVSWYEQGVRFLDVSNPFDIRQVGYYMPAVSESWASQWKPGTNLVYTFDYARGLEVLRFSGTAGDPQALAPFIADVPQLSAPSEKWGYACRIPNMTENATN